MIAIQNFCYRTSSIGKTSDSIRYVLRQTEKEHIQRKMELTARVLLRLSRTWLTTACHNYREKKTKSKTCKMQTENGKIE